MKFTGGESHPTGCEIRSGLSAPNFRGRALDLLLCALLLLQGCFSNGHGGSDQASKSSSPSINNPVSDGKLASGVISAPILGSKGSGPVFVISKKAPTPSNPAQSFDIYGPDAPDSSSPEVSRFCPPSSSSTNPSCSCLFFYQDTNGTHQISQPVGRLDFNMVQCRVPQLLFSKTDLSVAIEGASATSNHLSFDLSELTGLPTTDPETFAQVRRFQCRDLVHIPYLFPFDNSTNEQSIGEMYDPIQSAMTTNSYGLNYYTRNMGRTLLLMGSVLYKDMAQWECATNPQQLPAWVNLKLFTSQNSLFVSDTGTPPPDKLQLSQNFFVAKDPTSLFQQPVHGRDFPNSSNYRRIYSITNPDIVKPLGYGVPVDNDGKCPGNSNDPTKRSLKIPPNFTWAKLWTFRAELPKRFVITAGDLKMTQHVGHIYCNAGHYKTSNPGQDSDGQTTDTRFNEDCSLKDDKGNVIGSQAPSLETPGTMAARLVERVTNNSASNPAASVCTTVRLGGSRVWPGADTWTPFGGRRNQRAYQTNLADLFWPSGMTETTPEDTLVPNTTTSFELDKGAPRADYLLVITPDMALDGLRHFNVVTPDNFQTLLPDYIPVRYVTRTQCTGEDASTCSGDDAVRVQYSLITSASEQGTDTSSGGTFESKPICVLTKR